MKKLIILIMAIHTIVCHTPIQSAAADTLHEKLLEDTQQCEHKHEHDERFFSSAIKDYPQHERDKQLLYATFEDDIKMAQYYLLEAGANPNATYQSTKNCNNKLTRCISDCCSSEYKYKITPCLFLFPCAIALLSGMNIGITYAYCNDQAARWNTFCTSFPENYYCDPISKKNESWKTLCTGFFSVNSCNSTIYENENWVTFCFNTSHPTIQCDPITKQNESWFNSCPHFIEYGPTWMDSACKIPWDISPCTRFSKTFGLTLSSTPFLISIALLYHIKAKAAGKNSCCWKKKVNYLMDGKTPLMIAAQKTNPHQPENNQIISLLLNNKAHVNTTDNNGSTALLLAVINNNINAVETLSLADADAHYTNMHGQCPLKEATDQTKKLLETVEKTKQLIRIVTHHIPITPLTYTIIEYSFDDTFTLVKKYIAQLKKTNNFQHQPHNHQLP